MALNQERPLTWSPFLQSSNAELLDLVCKRYGILPSEMVKRNPFWIDFDTAVAYKGQMEQSLAEEEAMKKSQSDSKLKNTSSSPSKGFQPPRAGNLSQKVRGAQTVDDIIKSRNNSSGLIT